MKKIKSKKQPYSKQLVNNELLLSKVREIFKNIYNKRLDKIDALSKAIDYGDLKFIISSGGTETDSTELKDRIVFFDKVRKREISIEEKRHKKRI